MNEKFKNIGVFHNHEKIVMNVKIFSQKIDTDYNRCRYMIMNNYFPFIKTEKGKYKLKYYFDIKETLKYINEYEKEKRKLKIK